MRKFPPAIAAIPVNRDIVVMLFAALLLVVSACGSDEPKHCPGSDPCTPGDMCAGFESDYECTSDGHWKCVPSGNVGDPCVAVDAGVDAP